MRRRGNNTGGPSVLVDTPEHEPFQRALFRTGMTVNTSPVINFQMNDDRATTDRTILDVFLPFSLCRINRNDNFFAATRTKIVRFLLHMALPSPPASEFCCRLLQTSPSSALSQGLNLGYIIAKRPPLSDFAFRRTPTFRVDEARDQFGLCSLTLGHECLVSY